MGSTLSDRPRQHPRRAHRRRAHPQGRDCRSNRPVSKSGEETDSSMSTNYRVAIAGATGAVGVEFLRSLEERRFPMSSLRLLASARSRGKKMTFAGREIEVEEMTRDSFADTDIAFFSAGGSQ